MAPHQPADRTAGGVPSPYKGSVHRLAANSTDTADSEKRNRMKIADRGIFLDICGNEASPEGLTADQRRRNTMADRVLTAHDIGGGAGKVGSRTGADDLHLRFDALVSPDNNYVSILQSAIASGLKRFPVPYVLTNCHNSLCAVGGTVNEDDHVFGQDCARRYGGIFVPPYRAVLHQYMREMMAGCGRMILGSDSHTRYGALGTIGIGEGGGEIVKQLMGHSYDLTYPKVTALVLTGAPRPGIGPMDIALTVIKAAAGSSLLKNRIIEVIGPGIESLTMDMRLGIDVMTTESGALSSIWMTDERTHEYLREHGREDDYSRLAPAGTAYYDACVWLDLSEAEPMMALPYSPENVVSIREFLTDPQTYLKEVEEEGCRIKKDALEPFSVMSHLRGGEVYVDQGLISGCSGGLFENIADASDILRGHVIDPSVMPLGINPASLPIQMQVIRSGAVNILTASGALLKPSMCGGCFGAGDVPANNSISIRHVTRNYPNREGSKPGQGQMACTILMDARSIAATAANGGRITAATDMPVSFTGYEYHFDRDIYESQVCDYRDKCDAAAAVRMGPSIKPWPDIPAPRRHLLVRVAGCYSGCLTTDELIPSGDATAYRSNPMKLADFTLISKDPGYRERAKAVQEQSLRLEGGERLTDEAEDMLARVQAQTGCGREDISIGSMIAGHELGAGSSREQAVSCQRVLGGWANLANEYSTKRYRSNCINWGILPLETSESLPECVNTGDWLLIQDLPDLLASPCEEHEITDITSGRIVRVHLGHLTDEEKSILQSGCLLNYYKKSKTADGTGNKTE